MATLLVDSASNQREPDVESANVPVELAPLADAFRAAVSDMLEAYEAQKRFTENAAHELKTPLTVARISIEKFRGIDESERSELLNRIDVTAEMVQRLLELSRAQQKSAFRTQKFSMLDVLETVRDMLSPVAEKQGVTIIIESSVSDLCFLGDRTAWIVAIKNLVDNALKHAEGVTTIDMVLDWEQLRVENDGSSIKGEHRAHIFERFFRGGASKISSGGLGLSIVQEIVESSGGSIRHFDRQPSGSSFIIAFGDMPRPKPSTGETGAGQ
jgi:signal transduction histidine kinase